MLLRFYRRHYGDELATFPQRRHQLRLSISLTGMDGTHQSRQQQGAQTRADDQDGRHLFAK